MQPAPIGEYAGGPPQMRPYFYPKGSRLLRMRLLQYSEVATFRRSMWAH